MIAALLLLAAAESPTPAVDPTTFDLRCMIAMANLRESPDPAVRTNSTAASIFYFGRVDARLSEAELERRLADEAARSSASDQQALLHQCGAFMEQRGAVLSRIGANMTARESGVPAR